MCLYTDTRVVCNASSGFMLVELAIVLVIIGLIVGGVLTGQTLIRQAELRSVITDIRKFDAGALAFYNKYNGLPGDIANATTYWGTAAGCATTAGPGVLTCNGDDNGGISSGLLTDREQWRFWQHLSNASMIEGAFTGSDGPGGLGDSVPGTNTPRSRLSSNATYNIFYITDDGSGIDYFPMRGNIFILGMDTSGGWNYSAITNTEDTYSVDAKMDDSFPGQGIVQTFKQGGSLPNCTTTTDPVTSRYDLTRNSLDCLMIFKASF